MKCSSVDKTAQEIKYELFVLNLISYFKKNLWEAPLIFPV